MKKLILDLSPWHKIHQEVSTISEYSPNNCLCLYLCIRNMKTTSIRKRTHEVFIKKDKSEVITEDFPGEILRMTCNGTTDYSQGSLPDRLLGKDLSA